MFTLKQLEALYWVATLGSFEAAGSYLNVTQSTISKRIGELEGKFPVPLFDRSSRQSILTSKGQDIRDIAEQMLRLNDRLTLTARTATAPPFRFRLGVTDLVALSWLPQLLATIMERYPGITLEPEIDLTSGLLDRLNERRIDFVICPRLIQHPQFVNMPLGEIELVWMCSPKLYGGSAELSREDLLKFPLLIQSAGSMLRPILQDVIDNPRMPFTKTISCNNMAALAELAAHGLGLTILPKAFFSRYVTDGRLRIIRSALRLPKLEYFITYRNDYSSLFFEEIAQLGIELCDFDHSLAT
ncbi:LysR family transcriptional regulator [Rhizobium sp. NFR03]|uniref:LysR family transcriptional regulator n=1 Tax=Rhizobium sp. NFR03 TaxID=1566263 RepID=UPI0008B053ED|nr:LysR family transcriptional regulator [Rhizobium sp. NFR03]SES42487.1 DNA-binding transcriptional regulator, LysR family [Rhizobium sp. NFR03]